MLGQDLGRLSFLCLVFLFFLWGEGLQVQLFRRERPLACTPIRERVIGRLSSLSLDRVAALKGALWTCTKEGTVCVWSL